MGIINTLNFITRHPLNEHRKLKSVRRWLTWQIGSRLVPGPVAVNFVNDTVLLIAPSMTGATGNIYTGLHEFNDMSFVLHLLRPAEVFVDVGANVGAYTVLAGGIGARCISFEPVESSFKQLMLNVHLNGIHASVDARNLGIGSQKGTLKFTQELDALNHVVVGSETIGVSIKDVEVDTLDHVVAESQPILIKIDVEGFETEVVVGAENVLSKTLLLAVIMELNGSGRRYGYDEEVTYKRMLDYGFTPHFYNPFERSLKALNGKNERAGNTLFIRDLKAVADRLKSASAFTVGEQSI
jgi:FkbM family methyltransferase